MANRDFVTLAGYLADDVTWTIGGPVDLLPFCGERVGKTAVMTLLDRIAPAFVDGRRFIVNAMLVDGDRAAVLARFGGTKRLGGRAISFRTTHFIRFSGQKKWSNIFPSSTASTRWNRCSVTRLACTETGKSPARRSGRI